MRYVLCIECYTRNADPYEGEHAIDYDLRLWQCDFCDARKLEYRYDEEEADDQSQR